MMYLLKKFILLRKTTKNCFERSKKTELGRIFTKKITKLNSKVSFAKRNIAWLHYFPKTILKIFCFDKKKFQIEIWKDQFLKKKYRQTLIEKGTADFLKKNVHYE